MIDDQPLPGASALTDVDFLSDHGECPFATQSQRPLGIIHLMMWTACSAILLAPMQLSNSTDGMSREYQLYRQVSSALFAILYGAALPSLAIMISRWIRGGPRFPAKPGHWLLVVTAWQCVIFLGAWLAYLVLLEGKEDWGTTPIGLYLLSVAAPQVVVFAVASWRFRGQFRWRSYFLAHCVTQLLMSFGFAVFAFSDGAPGTLGLSQNFSSCLTLMWLAWLFIVVIQDKRNRLRGDWLHWTGVAVAVLSQILHLANVMVTWLLVDWLS